jgi:hypothetical protein
MKIKNLKMNLVSADGEELKYQIEIGRDKDKQPITAIIPLTLKSALIKAIMFDRGEKEQKRQPEEIMKLQELSMHISQSDEEIDVTAEELTFIRKNVAESFVFMTAGAILWQLRSVDK